MEKRGKSALNRIKKILTMRIGPLPKKEIALFLEQFSALTSAGVQTYEAVGILSRQRELKYTAPVLTSLQKRLGEGFSFSESAASLNEFPPFFTAMLRTGENTGKLQEVTRRLGKYYRMEEKRRERITRAMIYPVVVLITLILVLLFLFTYVMPTFTEMFARGSATPPLSTRILLGISGVLTLHGPFILLAIVAAVFLFMLLKRNDRIRYKIDRFSSTMPLFRELRRQLFTEKAAAHLALTVKSGLPLLDGLDILITGTKNGYRKKELEKVREALLEGEDLPEAFRRCTGFTELFPTFLEIGERTGNLYDGLAKASRFYTEETERRIENHLALLEPVMILVMSIVVGFVVLSVAVPMFDLVNSMEIY